MIHICIYLTVLAETLVTVQGGKLTLWHQWPFLLESWSSPSTFQIEMSWH